MSLLPTIREEGGTKWLQQLSNCRLQFGLMAPASMVFVAGGLKLGWSLYELPSGEYDYDLNPCYFTISWFTGAIIGAILGAMFVGRLTKNIFHILSGSLLIVGGILFILLPVTFVAIALSCTFEGTAFGLLQLQAFVTGAEVASREMRGLIMSTERCSIWFGILVQLTLTYFWYSLEPTAGHTMHTDQIHGIVVACIGITMILCTLKQRTKSPLFLLKQQRDMATAATIKQLKGVQSTSNAVIRMRENYLQLLAVDATNTSWHTFRKHNMLPLFKVITLRCFVTLSMSQPFNSSFLSASWLGFNCDMNCLYTLTLTGLFGSLLGGLLIDRCGRRKLCVITLFPATILMFIAGGIMDYLSLAEIAIISFDLEIVSMVILLYQFIICTGVAIAATAYLAEAFTATQKPFCIAVVLMAEHLLQIFLTVISIKITFSVTVLFFTMGVLSLQLGLYVFFCMPETSGLTLFECLQKFRGVSLVK